MEFNCTRRIRRYGDSFAVSLNKHLMERKGFKLGDTVTVKISPFQNQTQKDKLFADLAAERMQKDGTKTLVVKMPEEQKENEPKEEQTEEHKDDITKT